MTDGEHGRCGEAGCGGDRSHPVAATTCCRCPLYTHHALLFGVDGANEAAARISVNFSGTGAWYEGLGLCGGTHDLPVPSTTIPRCFFVFVHVSVSR